MEKRNSMDGLVDDTQSMDDSSSSWSMMNEDAGPALQTTFRCLHSTVGATIAAPLSTHVCWTVTARSLAEEQRAAVDIMVALDVSGSMNGQKLELCKRTLRQLLRLLSGQDRFGLITYASSAVLNVPLGKVTAEHKAMALSTIQGVRARDNTNISSAIGLAFQELRGATDFPNTIQTVFLLTDGKANEGMTRLSELEAFTTACVKGPAPIQPIAPPTVVDTTTMLAETSRRPTAVSMYCFGYGSGHDEHLLASLSAAASGSYYNIDEDSAVDGAFGDALGGIVSMVAQNATATFRLHPDALAQGARMVKIHHHAVVERENGSFSVHIGDFYAEESRDIVIELQLAPTRVVGATVRVPHVVASVAYSDVAQKIPVQCTEQTVSIERGDGTVCSELDEYVAKQVLRVSTTAALERARAKADLGDLVAARGEIAQARSTILASPIPVQSGPMMCQLQSDLTSISCGLASASMYGAVGSKALYKASRSHRDQRSSESTYHEQSANAYTTSFKNTFLGRMTRQPKDP
jgi:Mg-chelatase subunit ChlD